MHELLVLDAAMRAAISAGNGVDAVRALARANVLAARSRLILARTLWSGRNHWIAPGVLVVVAALAWYAYEVVPGLLLGNIDCANDVQAISRSPNDVYESMLFLRNCGATTGSVSIVTIRHADAAPDPGLALAAIDDVVRRPGLAPADTRRLLLLLHMPSRYPAHAAQLRRCSSARKSTRRASSASLAAAPQGSRNRTPKSRRVSRALHEKSF